MDISDFSSLVTIVTDKDLKEAIEHSDWNAAYEHTLADQELPFVRDDVGELVTFLHMITQFTFYVEDGKLMCGAYMEEPAFWRNGEWIGVGDEDDDE